MVAFILSAVTAARALIYIFLYTHSLTDGNVIFFTYINYYIIIKTCENIFLINFSIRARARNKNKTFSIQGSNTKFKIRKYMGILIFCPSFKYIHFECNSVELGNISTHFLNTIFEIHFRKNYYSWLYFESKVDNIIEILYVDI